VTIDALKNLIGFNIAQPVNINGNKWKHWKQKIVPPPSLVNVVENIGPEVGSTSINKNVA
tara:strand:- start:231 stop:410 length:180 start_codon:yes stop_codon:yes gene_type:complete